MKRRRRRSDLIRRARKDRTRFCRRCGLPLVTKTLPSGQRQVGCRQCGGFRPLDGGDDEDG